MKRIISIAILLAPLIAALWSCKRDDLYYARDERALIRITADWTQAGLTPNGLSAYVYDQQGFLFEDPIVSNDPSKVDLSLPVGIYSVVVLNNTTSEYKNVVAAGVDRLNTFALMSKIVPAAYKLGTDEAEPVIAAQPDEIAKAIVREVVVTPQMIDYYKHKPSIGEGTPAQTFAVEPAHITAIADIEVHVIGLKYALGAPRTHLRNFSGGYLLDSDTKTAQQITHEFVLNNRTFDSGSTVNGTISKQLSTFGLHAPSSGIRYFLNMEFVLLNKEKYPLNIDITDQIRVIAGSRERLRIRLEIELPEIIGGSEGEGAFNPDIEDWNDIEVEIPM